MAAVDISALIICDDIRKEVTNKDILIGIYAGDIVLASFPNWFNASIWMEITCAEAGEKEFEFRISLRDKPPIPFKMKFKTESPGTSSAAIPGLQFLAEGETELLIELREGDNWRVLKRKKIIKGVVQLPFVTPTFIGGAPSDK